MTDVGKELDEAISINETIKEQLERAIPQLEKILDEHCGKLEEMKLQLSQTESTLDWLKMVKTKAAAQVKPAAAPPGQLPAEAREASTAVPDDKSGSPAPSPPPA